MYPPYGQPMPPVNPMMYQPQPMMQPYGQPMAYQPQPAMYPPVNMQPQHGYDPRLAQPRPNTYQQQQSMDMRARQNEQWVKAQKEAENRAMRDLYNQRLKAENGAFLQQPPAMYPQPPMYPQPQMMPQQMMAYQQEMQRQQEIARQQMLAQQHYSYNNFGYQNISYPGYPSYGAAKTGILRDTPNDNRFQKMLAAEHKKDVRSQQPQQPRPTQQHPRANDPFYQLVKDEPVPVGLQSVEDHADMRQWLHEKELERFEYEHGKNIPADKLPPQLDLQAQLKAKEEERAKARREGVQPLSPANRNFVAKMKAMVDEKLKQDPTALQANVSTQPSPVAKPQEVDISEEELNKSYRPFPGHRFPLIVKHGYKSKVSFEPGRYFTREVIQDPDMETCNYDLKFKELKDVKITNLKELYEKVDMKTENAVLANREDRFLIRSTVSVNTNDINNLNNRVKKLSLDTLRGFLASAPKAVKEYLDRRYTELFNTEVALVGEVKLSIDAFSKDILDVIEWFKTVENVKHREAVRTVFNNILKLMQQERFEVVKEYSNNGYIVYEAVNDKIPTLYMLDAMVADRLEELAEVNAAGKVTSISFKELYDTLMNCDKNNFQMIVPHSFGIGASLYRVYKLPDNSFMIKKVCAQDTTYAKIGY